MLILSSGFLLFLSKKREKSGGPSFLRLTPYRLSYILNPPKHLRKYHHPSQQNQHSTDGILSPANSTAAFRPAYMDLHMPDNQNGTWTNEKHVHFLNTMEASFVRTMFEANASRHLRLDRYLPDSSESTLDLKSQRPKNHATNSGDIRGPRTRRDGRADRRSRRLSSQNHDPSQDQVVPQMGSRGSDKDERSPSIVAPAN